jgi:hypothetical protein
VKLFDLGDYIPVLAAIDNAKLDLILVGGHAVSVYAHKYRPKCPELERYLPFRSKDADWLGSITLGMRLASSLGSEWKRNPTKGGMRGLSLGHIPLPGVAGAKVEILGKILGADTDIIRKTTYVESYRGHRYKVINPFLLYETKGSNLVRIPQQRETGARSDAKQFAIMGLVVREVLRELAAQPEAERALVKACGRLVDFWLGGDGAALVRGGAAKPREILPIQELENHAADRVQNFVNKRLPHFERQLTDCISRVPPSVARNVEMQQGRDRGQDLGLEP